MAISGVGGGGASGGRRKSLDAEVNLVPFIDLLSMCICFLLMTAVWTQLGAVQVKQSTGSDAAQTTAQNVDIDVKFTNAHQVVFSVKKSGKLMKQITVLGETESELSSRANTELAGVKGSLASQGLKVAAVMITPGQEIPYGQMVLLMDAFRKNEMVNIGIVPVKPTGGYHASR